MSFDSPSVCGFYSYFKVTVGYLLKQAIGLPDSAGDFETSFGPLATLERITMSFMIYKKGYKQTNSNIPKNYDVHISLLRLLSLVCIIRMFILCNTNDETIQTYLGDPFYQHNDRKIITILTLLATTGQTVYREFILHIESKGCLEQMTFLAGIKEKGFDRKSLRMTGHQVKVFRIVLYTFIVNNIRIIKTSRIAFPAMYLAALILNSHIHDNKRLLIFGIIWAAIQGCCIVYLICCNIASNTHIIIFAWYKYCQVNSLLEIIRVKVYQQAISISSLRKLNRYIIIFMNELDNINKSWRYAIFLNIFLVSMLDDTAIFACRIMHQENKLLTATLLGIGISGVMANGAALYTSGAILSQLYKIHGIYLSLMRESNMIGYQEKVKIFEILERIISNYSGIKCGDAFIITKISVITFVLENASLLMMFMVNASYFEE